MTEDQRSAPSPSEVSPVSSGMMSEQSWLKVASQSMGPKVASRRVSVPLDLPLRVPERGWRRFIYLMTGGVVKPGLGRHERDFWNWVDVINSPIPLHTIAVLGCKGGTGVTSTALGLGNAFGRYFSQGVLALEAKDGTGTLRSSNGSDSSLGVPELAAYLRKRKPSRKTADPRPQLDEIIPFIQHSRGTRLDVLGSGRFPERERVSVDIGKVIRATLYQWPLVVVDTSCGDGDRDIVSRVLSLTMTPVIATLARLDHLLMAQETIEMMTRLGYGTLLPYTTAVVLSSTDAEPDRVQITKRFTDLGVSHVHFIPFDPYVSYPDNLLFLWDELHPETRRAWMSAAATTRKLALGAQAPSEPASPSA